MKLLQCYIENFGKLHNFSFDFSSGLNSIKEENGWGKSTFATFIKSMFYGLPSTTKRNLEENERKKYMPWQGGNFGGNIEFETNGKHYRIERFFGKNNSEDKFNLIDLSTGKKSNAFTNNIGEELFGLDGEAFERSAFIPQKILDSNINESISNKLTNLIQGTTEKFNYEEAQTSLNQKRVTLQNNKGTGKIQEIESEIDTIIQKINELNTSALAIKELQRQVNLQETEIQNLTNQQNEVKQQINSYSHIQEQIAHQEMYQKLKVQLETTENEILENQKILKNKNVSPTELNFFHELNEKINQKENELNIKNNNNYLKHRFSELENYFGAENKIPTTEEINTVTNDIARFNALQINLNKSLETQTKTGNISSKIFLTLILLLSVICLGIGIALFNTVLILSVVLVIVSILGLIFAAFLYLKNMINLKTSGYQHVNYDTQTNQAEISNLKNRIENFINQYEPSQIDYQIAFNNIISNIKELLNIKQQLEIIKISNAEIIKNINEDRNKLENFLSQFNLHESLSPKEQLMLLERTIENINNLQIRRSKEQVELNKFMADKNFNINSIFVDNLNISDLQNADKQIQDKIDICRDLKANSIAKIEKIQNDISALDDLENEREVHKQALEKLKKELNAIKNAKKFLEEANDSLSTQFLQPMKNGLEKYLKLITSKDFKNLQLDTNFNISFEEYGILRDVDYYSEGYKNTIDLCMRLALIDALYDREKPFIVLDDPFINMDEEKIKNAKEFLNELSNNYQLIYFSCHESRC